MSKRGDKVILDDSVLLIMDVVEEEGNEQIMFTENSNLQPMDYVVGIQYLVSRVSSLGNIPYNEVLDDLKQPEEDNTEPTEANTVKEEEESNNG